MMSIRPDQIAALERAIERRRRYEMLGELEREHPGRPEVAEVLDDVIDDADAYDIRGQDEVRRFARLVLELRTFASVEPLYAQALIDTLYNRERSGTRRLDFIERHILPRIRAGQATNRG
jgi:hypothetical protein